ncbi:hypothetical protein LWF15_24610 [Kineosporia rhizophila]|uniref:hypothetical protein n=1 Tax=Kineosporia TaxID=49184 RepID=UPI000AB0D4DD|nr:MULTISPECIES: hypothetical protein [Kineosporia]MCE0538685.1 hypothetical protein [Kineosporia rhizophila]GLY19463.1 hypothetical protein Kisp01_64770 [Kineosporia sp. NBRC 101677]
MRAATRRRIAVPAAITSGLLVSGLLVWHTSNAAFSGATQNAGNSFATGTVSLTSDRPGAVLFNLTGMSPGNPETECITVEYTGTAASTVTLAARYPNSDTVAAHPLATYLNFAIEEIPLTGDCKGASAVTKTADVQAAQTTLANKVANMSSGVGTGVNWAAATTGAKKRFRFVSEVQSTNSAQGLSATVNLVWTATSNA